MFKNKNKSIKLVVWYRIAGVMSCLEKYVLTNGANEGSIIRYKKGHHGRSRNASLGVQTERQPLPWPAHGKSSASLGQNEVSGCQSMVHRICPGIGWIFEGLQLALHLRFSKIHRPKLQIIGTHFTDFIL